MQSGQIAVLGGLMQDSVDNVDDTIPGVTSIPFIGKLFSQQHKITKKTELVIFLRAIVIRDPSIDGDYRGLPQVAADRGIPHPAHPRCARAWRQPGTDSQ